MNILFIGLSSIIKNRIIPAVEAISNIVNIDCASLSKPKECFVSTKARNFYLNYETAFAESDAEIVYISVRNHEHAYLVKKALEYNKHVIVDKPGVTEIEDAEEIVRIANEKNICVSEALVYGYHPQLELVRNIFRANNDFPSHITAHFTMPGFTNDNFRYKKQCDGGAIYDLGPYAMSIGFEFFGAEPLSCLGIKNVKDGFDVETSFNILLEYPHGQTFIGYFGFETEYMNSVSIFSKDIRVQLERIFTIPIEFNNEINIKIKNNIRVEKVRQVDIFKEYLIDLIKGINNNDFQKFKLRFLINARRLTFLRNSLK